MPIFKIEKNATKKLESVEFKNERDLQVLIENNLDSILDARFIATEYQTTHGGRIDTLGLDDTNSPVVIEYKKKANENIINQGLFYLTWLIDHKGDFEMLVQDKLKETIKVDWTNPRLILIAQSYNKYDLFAVSRISEPVELKKYVKYENDILLLEDVQIPEIGRVKKPVAPKISKVAKSVHTLEDQLARVRDKKVLNQINDLRDQIIAIDGNIKETYRKRWIQFKTSIQFCGISPYQKSFTLAVKLPKSEIKDDEIEVRPVKGHKNWSKIKIYPDSNITSLIDIIERAYRKTL